MGAESAVYNCLVSSHKTNVVVKKPVVSCNSRNSRSMYTSYVIRTLVYIPNTRIFVFFCDTTCGIYAVRGKVSLSASLCFDIGGCCDV